MEKANFGQIVSFLFGIANDCLVDTYDVGDYRKIILPMMVIRRFDAVLEPTKEKVLKMKEQLDAAGITDQDEALCSVAGEAFCNSSPYTLSDLKSRTNQQQLKSDFILYLNGFSQNVQDIIKRFEFRNQIDKLSEHDILGLLISKFTDSSVNLSNRPIYDAKGNLVQPALDNHTMGTVFEEVIRKFNEETNITDAGRHFTPRDIVELITDLAFVPVKGKIQSTTYRIYDGACGTGGMLTVAEGRMQEMAKEFGKNVSIHLYGQENSDETYAIARSDMLVKGEGVQANNIFFGSTISNDGFSGETFDFMLSNPPFGTPWKTDLKAWGDIKKDEITDTRFRVNYKGEDFSLIPDIGDPQMLFLANNISKMKKNTVLGSRIVEVHNSSSLSTGKAGSGPSNLRQYIIEQDMCHDAGLYQIDLLNGSKTRVTEREYWAKKKGQLALDEENAVLAEQGLPVKQTKFETDKDKLREEIRMALSDAVSFEDFAEKLLRRGITVKESRGRLSYLTPDRTKPITARKLGDDFDKAAVFAIFVRNTKRVRAKTDTIHSAPAMQKIINERDTVSRMVDIDAAKEKGKGYEHWAKKHNLKNASRAYLLYKEMGFDSPEALATACDAAHEKLSDIRTEMKSVEATIAEKKELRNHVLNYHKTRYVIDEMKACKNEKARQKYRDEHDSDFIILNTAKCYFDSKGLKKLPSHKALQTEVEQLIKEKNELYNQYQTAKEEAQRLGTIRHNLEQTLGRKIEHKKEQER